MFGGDWHRVAKAELETLVKAGIACLALRLVRNQHGGDILFPQPAGKMPVHRRDPGPGIDDHQGDIGIENRGVGLGLHPARQRLRCLFLQPGRVDDAKIQVKQRRVGLPAVTGHPRRIIDKCDLPPNQPVEQRRLADIGTPDNGNGRKTIHAGALEGRGPTRKTCRMPTAICRFKTGGRRAMIAA